MRVIAVAIALSGLAASANGQATLSGVPDFSQHSAGSWQNYCAPTAGANVAYSFAQTYTSLGGPFPPSPGANAGADFIISDLAARMGTSFTGGTSALGLRNGLDSYLEDNWDTSPGGTDWNTAYHDGAVIGGSGLESTIQNSLSNGDGVILLIRWDSTLGGPPQGGGYDTPDMYDGGPQPAPTAAMGHAVTAVGYHPGSFGLASIMVNDPANNTPLVMHNWPGEGTAYGYTVNASDLTLNPAMGGATAIVYGVLTTNIPTPGVMAMLGLGLLVMMRRGR